MFVTQMSVETLKCFLCPSAGSCKQRGKAKFALDAEYI